MSGPWEKFAAAPVPDPPAADAKPWEKFGAPPAPSDDPGAIDIVKGMGKNFGESFRKNIGEPFLSNPGKTLIETGKGLGSLARSVASFASDPETEFGLQQSELLNPGSTKELREGQKKEQERAKELFGGVSDHFTERYGSMKGFKKALMNDPVGVAMDASILLSAGETGLAKVPGIARVGEIARAPLKSAGELAAHAPAGLTGKSVDAVKQAAKAGWDKEKEFLDSLNGKLPAEETVKLGANAIGNMRKARNKLYQGAMKILGLESEPAKPDKILRGWQEAQENFGHYGGFVTSERSVGLDKKLMDVLEDWYQRGQTDPAKFYHPEGLDALKKRIRSIKNNIPFEAREDRAYVGSLENFIREQITDQFPVYDKIMKDYHVASDGLEEMEKALSLGDKAMYDTGIRKMLQAMRNNSNSNFGNRLKMLDTLEKYGAKGLKSRLAGMEMSSGLPSGRAAHNPALTIGGALASGHPELLAALPFQSPRLVGRGMYYGGLGARSMKDLADAVLPQIPRAGLVDEVDQLAKEQPQ